MKRLILTLLLVTILASPVLARQVEASIVVCPTIVQSNYVDYIATSNLFAQYGPEWEGNPLVQQVGLDTYFTLFLVGSMALCKQDPGWQVVGLISWAIQTWAVNTHVRMGTAREMPLLFFQIRW